MNVNKNCNCPSLSIPLKWRMHYICSCISSGKAATYLGTRSQGMVFVPEKNVIVVVESHGVVILWFKLNSLTWLLFQHCIDIHVLPISAFLCICRAWKFQHVGINVDDPWASKLSGRLLAPLQIIHMTEVELGPWSDEIGTTFHSYFLSLIHSFIQICAYWMKIL